MFHIPDYAAAGDMICGWIADDLHLTAGQNIYRDQTWPNNPDTVVCVYETGGLWNVETGRWYAALALAVRAPRLVDAHGMMRQALAAVINGFNRTPWPNRNGALNVLVQSTPRVSPRDLDNRVFVDCGLQLEFDAPYDNGR